MYIVDYNSALNSWIYFEFNFQKNYKRGKMTYVLDWNVKAIFLNKCKKEINLATEILLDLKKWTWVISDVVKSECQDKPHSLTTRADELIIYFS